MGKHTISGNRFRLHVVIPNQFDFADAGARELAEGLLTRIRNTSMISDNASGLEENWMDEFRIWNGGIVDWYAMFVFSAILNRL